MTLTRASTSPQRLVFRARLILDYASIGNKTVAAQTHAVGRDTVRRWCDRWQASVKELTRLDVAYTTGSLSVHQYRRELACILSDAHRSGHPATITEDQKARILALASEEPERAGVPITNWTCDTLKTAVIHKGIVSTISRAHIGRFLKQSHTPATS